MAAKDGRKVIDPVAALSSSEGAPQPRQRKRRPAQVSTMESAFDGKQELEPDGLPACALGHGNPPGAAFCASCGLPMDAAAPPAQRVQAERPRPAAELTQEELAAREAAHQAALRTAAALDRAEVQYVPAEGETITIHFVEDGFTKFGVVWYRGQEITLGPSHPRWRDAVDWIMLDDRAQMQRYGRVLFRRGPWPGARSYATDYERPVDREGKPLPAPSVEELQRADAAERARGGAVPAPILG